LIDDGNGPLPPQSFDQYHVLQQGNFRVAAETSEPVSGKKESLIPEGQLLFSGAAVGKKFHQTDEAAVKGYRERESSGHGARLRKGCGDQLLIGRRHQGIRMTEEQGLALRPGRSGVHLPGPSRFALQDGYVVTCGNFHCPVRAAAVDEDDLGIRLACQAVEGSGKQDFFIERRDDD